MLERFQSGRPKLVGQAAQHISDGYERQCSEDLGQTDWSLSEDASWRARHWTIWRKKERHFSILIVSVMCMQFIHRRLMG